MCTTNWKQNSLLNNGDCLLLHTLSSLLNLFFVFVIFRQGRAGNSSNFFIYYPTRLFYAKGNLLKLAVDEILVDMAGEYVHLKYGSMIMSDEVAIIINSEINAEIRINEGNLYPSLP